MTQEDTSYVVSLKRFTPPVCMQPTTWVNKAEHWEAPCGNNGEFTVCAPHSMYVWNKVREWACPEVVLPAACLF